MNHVDTNMPIKNASIAPKIGIIETSVIIR